MGGFDEYVEELWYEMPGDKPAFALAGDENLRAMVLLEAEAEYTALQNPHLWAMRMFNARHCI